MGKMQRRLIGAIFFERNYDSLTESLIKEGPLTVFEFHFAEFLKKVF